MVEKEYMRYEVAGKALPNQKLMHNSVGIP